MYENHQRHHAAERRRRLFGAARTKKSAFGRPYAEAMRVVESRERRGLTQVDLATRASIDQGDTGRLASGSADPTGHTAARIGEARRAYLRCAERRPA